MPMKIDERTKIMRMLFSVLPLLLVGCTPTRTYQGQPVKDVPFVIAGGQVIQHPITDGGPLPAENEFFKIEAAGLAFSRDQGNPTLRWVFGMTGKKGQKVDRVLIEMVAPHDPALVLVDDKNPSFKGRNWSASTIPFPATKDKTPWLYQPNASVFVFRFTISVSGQTDQILFQPTWFSARMKAALVLVNQ